MDKEINIDGIKIAYKETGKPEGLPVILLHGWGCNSTTVSSIAGCLEDEMKVFSIDLPGHGKSEEPKTVWGTRDFSNMVRQFITMLGLQNVSIIGHSFGGRTAISAVAGEDDNLFWKVVLVDSAGIKPKRSLRYYYKVYSYKTLKKLAKVFLGSEKSKKLIDKMLRKSASADYLMASPQMRAIMSRCVNEDLKSELPKIKQPVLLIWGENDTATPISDAKIMEKLLPDAGLVAFPNCGHYSFLDNPFGFKAVLREFFKYELHSQHI